MALYYFCYMTGKPEIVPPTRMEAWYLECLVLWTEQKRRPPVLSELAGYCGKSRTAVYSALLSLEHKGLVRRVSEGDRRFVAVQEAA
jgi:hypothetical protein